MKYLIFIAGLVFSLTNHCDGSGSPVFTEGQLTDSLQKQQVSDATISLGERQRFIAGRVSSDSGWLVSFSHLKLGSTGCGFAGKLSP